MSTTSYLGSNNQLIMAFDNIQANVGVNMIPTYPLDVSGIARATTITTSTFSNSGNSSVLNEQINNTLLVKGTTTLFNTLTLSNNLGNVNLYSSNTFLGINNFVPKYELDVTGSGIFSGSVFSGSIGAGTNNTNGYSAYINGPIYAVTYCNLLLNNQSSSVNNAPTSALLSNVNNASVFASNLIVSSSNTLFPQSLFSSNTSFYSSNTAAYASNRIISTSWSNNGGVVYTTSNIGQYPTGTENLSIMSNMSLSNYGKLIMTTSNSYLSIGANYNPKSTLDVSGNITSYNFSKIIKSLDTSNPIQINLNLTNSYALNNQYYILLQASQILANATSGYGSKYSTLLCSVSNFSIIDIATATAQGSLSTNLNINCSLSNNKLIQLQSYTSGLSVGTYSHSLSVELISYNSNAIGLAWLS